MTYRVLIKIGDVLPATVLDRPITDAQASIIRELLDTPSLTYADALEFLLDQRAIARQNARLSGIEQYQTESR